MVNLTQPAMLCFGKVPDDPVFRHHFLQVTSHLQAYKEVPYSQYNNTICNNISTVNIGGQVLPLL